MQRRSFLRNLLIAGIGTASGAVLPAAQGRSVLALGMEAETLLHNGAYAQAIKKLREGLQLDPASDWLRGMLGQAYYGAGNHAAALDEFHHILRDDPENDLARMWVDLLSQRPLDRPVEPSPPGPLEREAVAEQRAYLQRLEQPAAPRGYRIRRIVIDAGHGGFDPGAVGPTGLQEKDVTLAIAATLERALRSRRPDLRIDLTRRGDYYVPLSERTVTANRYQADLFLSVHCNAHTRRGARGSETYFCSEQASSNEARRVAAVENAVLKFDTPPGPATGRIDIEDILFRLTRLRYWRESARLARVFQQHLAGDPAVPDRGVHSADFFVLRTARMPAILLEVAFISNRAEEQLLRSRNGIGRIAETIAAGIPAA